MILAAERISLAGRLAAVSLSFAPGEVVALVGPNGAGKSSLLSVLAGVLAPEPGGRVTLGEAALLTLPARQRARAIGYLPQRGEIAWDMTVATLVGLGRLPWRGSGAAEDAAAIAAALAATDLVALRDRLVSRLSGGERARALLARVLAGCSRWILADEPLAALDLGHGAALIATLKQAAADEAGVVLALHDLALAMNHATRVVVLAAGAVVADGPPEAALDAAVIARVWGVQARWLGAPGARGLALMPA